jgi:Acyl-CoA dehydrogenase, C-terminal domain
MTTLTRTGADIDRPQAPDILARVKEMRPWLREHQAMAEQQRRVPQESVERLDAAGVCSLTTPARFVWDACSSAIETLFRASGASAIMMRQPLQLIARNCRAGSLHAATTSTRGGRTSDASCAAPSPPRYRRACSSASPKRGSYAVPFPTTRCTERNSTDGTLEGEYT